MVYEVYAGGIHAVQNRMEISEADGRYDIVMNAETRGFLGKLAPWSGWAITAPAGRSPTPWSSPVCG